MNLVKILISTLITFPTIYSMEEKPEESKKPRYDLLRKKYEMREVPLEYATDLKDTGYGRLAQVEPGKLVFAFHDEKTLPSFVYNIRKQKKPMTFRFIQSPICSLTVGGGNYITGHENGDIFIRSSDPANHKQYDLTAPENVCSLAFDAKKNQLISSSWSRECSTICFYDITQDNPMRVCLKTGVRASLIVDEDERLLIVGGCRIYSETESNNLKFYDLDTYKLIEEMKDCGGNAKTLDVRKKLVIVGHGGSIIFVDYPDRTGAKKFDPIKNFRDDSRVIWRAHEHSICVLTVIADKQILISSDMANRVKTWDLTTKQCLQVLETEDVHALNVITSIVFDPLTQKLFTCGDNIKVWEVKKTSDEELFCIRDVKHCAETLKNCSWLAWLGCLYQMCQEKIRAQNTLSAPVIQQLNRLYDARIPVNNQK